MKKNLMIMILSAMIFTLVGCQSKTTDNVNNLTDSKNELQVNIIAKANANELNGMPIKLTPDLTGESVKEIQYHWILESYEGSDFIEGFLSLDGEPLREVTNSGEPVELGLFAEVNWVEGSVEEFKIKLQIEEKDSSKIITTDEITIENHAGIYKIK